MRGAILAKSSPGGSERTCGVQKSVAIPFRLLDAKHIGVRRRHPGAPRRLTEISGLAENTGRLADLDQVAIGIADVSADLASVILRLCQELDALR